MLRKKGSIEDIFLLIVFLFALAIFIGVVAYTFPRITDGLRETELNDSSEVRRALLETDTVATRLNAVWFILFVGLCIGILITSFLIDSHPVFLPIYIILLILAIVVGVVMSNAYEEFRVNSPLNETMTTQTFTTTVMDNFIPVLIGVGILSMIVIFGKAKLLGDNRI